MNFRIVLALSVLLLAGCSKSDIVLNIGEEELLVEVANTDALREKGLMFRESMDWNRGMLFVFQEERSVAFWMKNTKIPLDIAYIGKSGKILEIYDLKPFSMQSVQSKRSTVLYALEVNRGYFKKHGISVGDVIDLSPVKDYLNSSN